jgi:hypothetical protein
LRWKGALAGSVGRALNLDGPRGTTTNSPGMSVGWRVAIHAAQAGEH